MPPTLLASQLATLELGDDLVCVPITENAADDDEDAAAVLALQVLEQHASSVG